MPFIIKSADGDWTHEEAKHVSVCILANKLSLTGGFIVGSFG
jgi:hypothetical protein